MSKNRLPTSRLLAKHIIDYGQHKARCPLFFGRRAGAHCNCGLMALYRAAQDPEAIRKWAELLEAHEGT